MMAASLSRRKRMSGNVSRQVSSQDPANSGTCNIPEAINVLGHDSALYGYTGPGKTA